MSPLSADPRWRRLKERGFVCAGCGALHHGLFDLVFGWPEFWRGDRTPLPNESFRLDEDTLTEDFCSIGEHVFVRCILSLPLVGGEEERVSFGVWSSLSSASFEVYYGNFNDDRQGKLGPWFGWFANRIPGFPDTLGLKCRVHPRDGRIRPFIELEPTQHPLAVAQRNGISLDRALEIFALAGHDLRPSVAEQR